MVALIPRQISGNESALTLAWDELQAEACSRDWVVAHNVGILFPGEHVRKVVDFVVIIPQPAAIVCLEIKSSPFEVPDDGWFREAVKRGLENAQELRRRLPESGVPMQEIPVVSSVGFPDENWPDNLPRLGVEIYDMAIFDEDGELCRKLADFARRLNAGASGDYPRLKRSTIDALRRYLAPGYDLRYGWLPDAEERLLLTALSSMEYLALQLVADNPRCLFRVTGDARRKSEMAVECLYRRHSGRPEENIALLCSDPELAVLLGRLTEDLPDVEGGTPGVTVKDWNSFIRGVIYDDRDCARAMNDDLAYRDAEASGDDRALRDIQIKYALDSISRNGPRFDYLIVDEAELLLQEKHLALMDGALAGGLTGGSWAVFRYLPGQAGDWPDRQDAHLEVERPLLRYYANPARLTARL